MISWVREKVAERRAKWSRLRNKDDPTNINNSSSSLEKSNSKNPVQQNDSTNGQNPAFPSVPPTSSKTTSSSAESSTTSLGNTSNNNLIRLRAYTKRGKSCQIEINKNLTGYDLKKESYRKLLLPSSNGSTTSRGDSGRRRDDDSLSDLELYYLILSKTRRKIDETKCLNEIFQANDEVILTRKKVEVEEPENLQGPKFEEILEATKNIEPRTSRPSVTNIENLLLQNDLQFDIRKILISLAQSSAYVIGTGPYAARLISMLKQRLLNRRKHEADTVQCLVDMGFDKSRATYALRIKNNVYAAALEWLIDNQNSSSLDQQDGAQSTPETSNISQKIENKNSSQEYVEALLEIIRIHAHRNVPPPKEMIKSLVEMGFPEDQVLEALKITRNNQAAACEWLVGGRSRSLTELREGLQTDSPVLKALLASPQVQISLGNPKMFLAYISMLENYSSMSMWLSDNDTSGILGHILRTYHEEKHIIAINQFSSML